jgi:hypothetical protein
MLAEIFFLKLETEVRAATEAAEPKKNWLVSRLTDALRYFNKNLPVDAKTA